MRVMFVTRKIGADSAMTFDFDVAPPFRQNYDQRAVGSAMSWQLALLAGGHDDRRAL